jgi:hypothetical protein
MNTVQPNKERRKMELKDTIPQMNSEDYEERFKAEYNQLKIRLEKLHSFCVKYDAGTLEFEPTCPIHVLMVQEKHMRDYLTTLEVRAEIEGIELAE